MHNVFCDKCNKEIQRDEKGDLTFWQMKISRDLERPVARPESRDEFVAQLCLDCWDALKDALVEVRFNRSQRGARGTGSQAAGA